ncbi:MAG: GAF domain-containing protein, partial [Bacteroidota bacterium]
MKHFFYNLSIRAKMIYTSLIVGILLIFIGGVSYFYINKIMAYGEVSYLVDKTLNLTLQLRRAEKDFLLREKTNMAFFQTGDSKYLNRFENLMDSTQKVLAVLADEKVIKELGFEHQIADIGGYYQIYEQDYHNLVQRIRTRGYKSYGFTGRLNESYRALSASAQNNKTLSILPEIRRLENAYLLYKDKAIAEELRTLLSSRQEQLIETNQEQFLKDLQTYTGHLNQVLKIDEQIGLSPDTGFRGTLRDAIHKVEDEVNLMARKLRENIKESTQEAYVFLFTSIIAIAAVIITLLLLTSSSVIRPIERLNELINTLAHGGLPKYIVTEGKGRIAEMTSGVKMLVERLRETTRFSLAIGQAEFDYEFTPLSDKDDLANALLEMRDNLKSANEEAQRRKIEDEHRNWASQGIALFSDLMRQQTNDLQALGYAVISKLVDYTDSVQGGLFMLNEEDESHPYIEMMGCYAYDRQKYFTKHIEFGEGLIGRCVQEGKSIYMTDIPEGYTHITSGLGKATPGSLLIVPLKVNEKVYGVVELASFNVFADYQIELVEKVGENIAATLSSVKINVRTSELLERTRQQAEEMAAQEEEMRQNMEELQATQEESERQKEALQLRLQEAEKQVERLREQLR